MTTPTWTLLTFDICWRLATGRLVILVAYPFSGSELELQPRRTTNTDLIGNTPSGPSLLSSISCAHALDCEAGRRQLRQGRAAQAPCGFLIVLAPTQWSISPPPSASSHRYCKMPPRSPRSNMKPPADTAITDAMQILLESVAQRNPQAAQALASPIR